MLEIEKLDKEIQDKILQLFIEGWSNSAIAEKINAEYNLEITPNMVYSFCSKRRKNAFKVAIENEKFQKKLAEQYFNTIQQLRRLNGEMWSFFYELKQNPPLVSKSIDCPRCKHHFKVSVKSFDLLLKTAEHLLKQIRHVDEVLGKVQNQKVQITYNYVDLSKKLVAIYPNILKKAEKLGLVKINKRKLKDLR